jgi:hypothetical protein
MAAAVPFAIKGGSMLAGSLIGKFMNRPSKEQKSAMAGTQAAGNALSSYVPQMMGQSSQLAGQGSGALGQAAGYYRNILGSRAGMRQALAPETATTLDYYRGAAGKASRSMRGGARDAALAELDRSKVGNLAMQVPMARANAAEGLGNIGNAQLGAAGNFAGVGGNLASNAAYVNSGLFNQASQMRQQQGEGGKAWGSLLYDMADSLWGKKKAA